MGVGLCVLRFAFLIHRLGPSVREGKYAGKDDSLMAFDISFIASYCYKIFLRHKLLVSRGLYVVPVFYLFTELKCYGHNQD